MFIISCAPSPLPLHWEIPGTATELKFSFDNR